MRIRHILHGMWCIAVLTLGFCVAAAGASAPRSEKLAPPTQLNSELAEELQRHDALLRELAEIAQILAAGQEPLPEQVRKVAETAGPLWNIQDPVGVFDPGLGVIRIQARQGLRRGPSTQGSLNPMQWKDRLVVPFISEGGQLILQPQWMGAYSAIPYSLPKGNANDAFNYFDHELLSELLENLSKRGIPDATLKKVQESLVSLKGAIKYNAAGEMITDNYILSYVYRLLQFAGMSRQRESFFRFVREMIYHELVHDYLRGDGKILMETIAKDPEFPQWRLLFARTYRIPQDASDGFVAEEIAAKAASYFFEGEGSKSVRDPEVRRAVKELADKLSRQNLPYDNASPEIFRRLVPDLPLAALSSARDSAQKKVLYGVRKLAGEAVQRVTRPIEEVKTVNDAHTIDGQIQQLHLILGRMYVQQKIGPIPPEPLQVMEARREDLTGFFLQLMENPSEEVREFALNKLQEMGADDAVTVVLGILEQRAPSPLKSTLLIALRAGGKLGGGQARLRDALSHYCGSEDYGIRREALLALCRQERKLGDHGVLGYGYGEEKTFHGLLAKAGSGDVAERKLAVEVLSLMEDPRSAEVLLKISQEPDRSLANLALEGLKGMGMDFRQGLREKRRAMRALFAEYLRAISNGDRVSVIFRPDTGGITTAALFHKIVSAQGKQAIWNWVPYGFEKRGFAEGILPSDHVVVLDIPFPAQPDEYHELLHGLSRQGRLLWVDNWDSFSGKMPEERYGIGYISPSRLGSSLPSHRYPTAKMLNDIAWNLPPGNFPADDWLTAVALSADRSRDSWMDVLHASAHTDDEEVYLKMGEVLNVVPLSDPNASISLLEDMIRMRKPEELESNSNAAWNRLDDVAAHVQGLIRDVAARIASSDAKDFFMIRIPLKDTVRDKTQWDLGMALCNGVLAQAGEARARTVFFIQETVQQNRPAYYVYGAHTATPGQETVNVGKVLFDLFGGNGGMKTGRALLLPREDQAGRDLRKDIEAKLRRYAEDHAAMAAYLNVLAETVRYVQEDPVLSENPAKAWNYLAEQTPQTAPFHGLRGEFLRMRFLPREEVRAAVQRLVFWRWLTPEIGESLIRWTDREAKPSLKDQEDTTRVAKPRGDAAAPVQLFGRSL